MNEFFPYANSAVSFAVPLDQKFIEPWLNKQSHADHFRNNIRANVIASGISLELSNYLNHKGYPSWSPGRFPIPQNDEAFYGALLKTVGPYLKRPKTDLAVFNTIMPGDKVELTCGNCQLVCHPDKEIRKKRYKMLTGSGVVVENHDGSREAVSAEEAKKRLTAMDPETRALYEEV